LLSAFEKYRQVCNNIPIMFTMLGLKYFLMVWAAIVGVIQAAAAYNGLRGLMFFPWKIVCYIFCGLVVAGVLTVMFLWNYLYEVNVVAGSEQAGWFLYSTAAAIIFTVIVSSLIHIRFYTPGAEKLKGLDALRQGNIIRVVWERLHGKH
jgi:hypothetical protein